MSADREYGHCLRGGASAIQLADGLVLVRLPDVEPTFPAGVLTPTEEEVATAVFYGATNQGVAEKRGVSVKTVANQLRSIYEKLGVASRVELVLALVESPSRPTTS